MFTARRMDESTGLYHYRRRAYDPERGRFLQRDPLGCVDGMNLREYVSSQPLARTDPSGMLWVATIVFRFADISPNNPAAWENYITGNLGVSFGGRAFSQWVYKTQMLMNGWQNTFRNTWQSRIGTYRTGFPLLQGFSLGLQTVPPTRRIPSIPAPALVGGAWALNPTGILGDPGLRPGWMPFGNWLVRSGGRLLARIGMGTRYENRINARRVRLPNSRQF